MGGVTGARRVHATRRVPFQLYIAAEVRVCAPVRGHAPVIERRPEVLLPTRFVRLATACGKSSVFCELSHFMEKTCCTQPFWHAASFLFLSRRQHDVRTRCATPARRVLLAPSPRLRFLVRHTIHPHPLPAEVPHRPKSTALGSTSVSKVTPPLSATAPDGVAFVSSASLASGATVGRASGRVAFPTHCPHVGI